MFKIITLLGLVFTLPNTLFANSLELDMASLVDDLMSNSNTIKKQINLSGKQRMLTQRVSKLALLISLGIDKENNQKRLMKFSNLYNDTLESFKGNDSKEINTQLLVINKAWKPFSENLKKIIEGTDKEGKALDYLIKNNENLLKESNILVRKYEQSNTSQNYMEKAMLGIINLAGRQRMLTQKMTKEKLLVMKGQKENSEKLEKTIKLFDDSLILLIKGDMEKKISKPTNQKIKDQLEKVSSLWKDLKPLYEKKESKASELAVLIEKNPLLLKEMHAMVMLVELETEY